MNLFDCLHIRAPLIAGTLLLCMNLTARADEVQDATKLFKQGQHSQALSKVNNYLAGKPKDAQARFLKGLIFTEQAKISDAIKTFSALSTDYPELPEPYNNLAVLYASQGQYDQAKLALESAIRTHPSYATAHENLGDIYAKMARQAYDRALQLDRSNAATQTKLSMIQELFAADPRGKQAAASGPDKKATATTPVVATIPVSTAISTIPAAKTNLVIAAEHKPVPAKANTNADIAAPDIPASMSDNHKETIKSEIVNTVNAWAAAWSSQNAKNYLAFYAKDFKTPAGETRGTWEATRRERLSAPKSIQIEISNATVEFGDDNHASVKFRQAYRANHLQTSGKKTLLLVKAEGKWLIQEERTK